MSVTTLRTLSSTQMLGSDQLSGPGDPLNLMESLLEKYGVDLVLKRKWNELRAKVVDELTQQEARTLTQVSESDYTEGDAIILFGQAVSKDMIDWAENKGKNSEKARIAIGHIYEVAEGIAGNSRDYNPGDDNNDRGNNGSDGSSGDYPTSGSGGSQTAGLGLSGVDAAVIGGGLLVAGGASYALVKSLT